ncbi:ATP/GTP-binding protein [Trueperella pyogenes]
MTKKNVKERPVRRPGKFGFSGPGRGSDRVVAQPTMWRGTSVQVCGLWPFAYGSGVPTVGVPLGRLIGSGETVCADPVSWFERARLISNPSVFVLGKPGLGKSTLIRRMVLGLTGFGTMPLILGDLKPDYVDLVEALGGSVIRFGRGRGHLNPLDPGSTRQVAARLSGAAREELLADMHGRQFQMTSALIEIVRRERVTDREETILDSALRILNTTFTDQAPTLPDLLALIRQAPAELRSAAVDRGSMERYREITEDLEASLLALTSSGRLGDTFAQPTDVEMDTSRPTVFDISGIGENDHDLQAAALLACWTHGFAAIEADQILADEGLAPRRHHFIVLDELWRVLRAGPGMVDRVDAITRLNRTVGVGQAMITHTMSDLEALPTEQERAKARGFVERSGMVICGGLPADEMPRLRRVLAVSRSEENLLTSWQDPPAWDSTLNREAQAPGLGKFLIKVGGRPGIPVQVTLIEAERSLSDTNQRWNVG